MTTESRMREALEQARVYIEGVAYGMPVDPTGPILSLISEALSPPARRTSYEWTTIDGVRMKVEFERRWEAFAKLGDWVMQGGDEDYAAAIATLAGLTPPEEKA